ncbi:MAG: glycosyltransferase [Cyclobacteriaceae bacterium]|nr:glycosyltransferase [Cyclobacteriaceae bacterium]
MNKADNNDVIILVTGSRWDQDYSSASISLAKELSKTNLVFFIDNPFTLKDVFVGWKTRQIKRRMSALLVGRGIYTQIEPGNKNWIAVTPMIVMPINWLPVGSIYTFFLKLNNKIFFRTIRRVIRDYSLKDFIYFNSYNPFYGYKLPPDINPSIKIYQSRDNIKESEYVNKHGPSLERLIAQTVDIRLATSTDLVNQLSTKNHPFFFFPNAADVDLFSKAQQIDDDLKDSLKLSKPVIGYIGNICLRIDYDLVYKLAKHFINHTLLMVGPRNDGDYNPYNFDELENVLFTGSKKIGELPAYLSLMDCAIMPFKKNALTRSIYPLKINEYLAAGKPVVTTSFSPDIESFAEVVHISDTHEDFISNVERALIENDPSLKQKRFEIAKGNSWSVRANQFWERIRTFQSS